MCTVILEAGAVYFKSPLAFTANPARIVRRRRLYQACCTRHQNVTGTAVSQVAKLLAIGTCRPRLAQAMEGA